VFDCGRLLRALVVKIPFLNSSLEHALQSFAITLKMPDVCLYLCMKKRNVLTFFFFFFCQIASLISDTSFVLNECMETLAQPQELKALLDTQKDLKQLEDIGDYYRPSLSRFV